jgi:uncharacterized protein YdbL (DUF1318 family)
MIRRAALVAVGMALAFAAPLPAQNTPTVTAGLASGVIGERFDGYLGYVSTASPGLRRQVDAVNIRRRALYSNLAGRRGVSPLDVGVTAACELLGRVAVGQAYMLGDGKWRRRAAGQAAPVPDYCR